MRLIATVVFAAFAWTCLAAEEEIEAGYGGTFDDVALVGTAAGGTLTLLFPPGSGAADLTIATAAGEPIASILARFVAQPKPSDTVDLLAVSGRLRVRGVAPGSVGLRSTDSGLVPPPPPTGAKAAPAGAGTMRVSWSIAADAGIDRIGFTVNGTPLGLLPADTGAYVHNAAEDLVVQAAAPAALRYRIIARRRGMPSAPVEVGVARP